MLHPHRAFPIDQRQRDIAIELYEHVADLPILSVHTHVDPALFADRDARFGTPTDVFITGDHYVLRMLHSQGIDLERLGVPRRSEGASKADPRETWRLFAERAHLFRGTPTGYWTREVLEEVFGMDQALDAATSDDVYDQLSVALASDAYTPRKVFDRFGIRVLHTTDAATDGLDHHHTIARSDWDGVVRPTFRPDGVVAIASPEWPARVEALGSVSSRDITDYGGYLDALRERRSHFRESGAASSDHGAPSAATEPLADHEAKRLFERALRGHADRADEHRFVAHMLVEFAAMSVEDGLVMQLHAGSERDHDTALHAEYGSDVGADIPVPAEYTHNLRPLLERFGNDRRLTLVVFTLDESTYSRELAPLAGHYRALRIGPPWWFHDSLGGMRRYLDRVVETAGLYNLAGFNDDARNFLSIPARHDLWRRTCASWMSSLVATHIVAEGEGLEMMRLLSYDLARSTYRIEEGR